jgi:O-antigen/teichoic acid export membrane protein
MSWSVSLVFIAFGEQIIHLLYDNRYAGAGWMLQVLSIGTLGSVLGLSYDGVLLANGKTFALATLSAIQTTIKIAAMFLGNHWGGQHGVIIGLAAATWIMYPAEAICIARIRLWQPEIDLPLIALASVVTAIFCFHT